MKHRSLFSARTLTSALILSGIGLAAFDADVVPPFRGLADTEFSGWEKMTVAFGGPNVPDEVATTSDDATLTQGTPGAILTSTCNIYNPAGGSVFTINDTVPLDLQGVYLQTRSVGSPILQAANLMYTDGGGVPQTVPASVTVLQNGSALELLFVWDLAGIADTITSYSIEFGAGAAHCSLDTVFLDTNFGDSVVGSSYCTAAINSTGGGAMISAFGSATVADNNFGVFAEGAPSGVSGIVFFGPNQIQVPFGDGFRCVGGATRRVQPPISANGLGEFSRTINLTTGHAATELVPGANRNFQIWYRDLAAGGAGYNLTDAVNVIFQ